MPEKPMPGEFGTVIGHDAILKGELTFETGLRVDGSFEGKIRTKGTVAVSSKGRVKAEIEAGQVLIEGEVEGELVATERIDLREQAKLRGNLRASKLLVAEGAVLTGQVQIGADAARGDGKAGDRLPVREMTPAPGTAATPVGAAPAIKK